MAMQTAQYPLHYTSHPQPYQSPVPGYVPFPPGSAQDPRFPPPPFGVTHAGPNNKRLAPPHPAESPAKKKQSKWSADEDAAIIELRGNGMKWEDISKNLPGRSAISCRLRFQNYLERRSEWDEEKKNKLARLYERFKKDMWEKISKEMALPWRAAEAMHWQIGEVEMAQRANVPVFHLAGYEAKESAAPSSLNRSSTSPRSLTGVPELPGAYPRATHSHALPQLAQPLPPPMAPDSLRLPHERGTGSPMDESLSSLLRHRADSARSVPTSSAAPMRTPALPPLGEIVTPQARYPLPPVVTSAEAARR